MSEKKRFTLAAIGGCLIGGATGAFIASEGLHSAFAALIAFAIACVFTFLFSIRWE